jgi:hypothetical protein
VFTINAKVGERAVELHAPTVGALIVAATKMFTDGLSLVVGEAGMYLVASGCGGAEMLIPIERDAA